MGTLRIPQRTVEIKALEIEKGELVLIRSKKQKEEGVSITLGVFEEAINYSEGRFYPNIKLAKSYRLRESMYKLGGQNICLIDYGNDYYQVNSSLEITVGKRNIVKRLREEERFAAHSDWIEKLNKPYLRD